MSNTTPAPPPPPNEPAVDSPPPAARPESQDEIDPVRELTRLAEQLARTHNRRLLFDYLRARRALR